MRTVDTVNEAFSASGRTDALPRVTSPILVTGGTCMLGRLVVQRLREAGNQVRVLSRRSYDGKDGVEFVTGDLATGGGVQQAVAGAEVIVHCAGSSSGDEVKTRHLVQALSPSRVRHLVYISVVGADRVPVASGMDRAMFGYFQSKLAAERVVAESGLPWTTLRATQFHDLMFMAISKMANLPVVPVPSGFRFSRSMPLKSRRGLWSLRSARPRAWYPTSRARGYTHWPS
jgi:uncharacterized protein YbjT (DUF2867 family)